MRARSGSQPDHGVFFSLILCASMMAGGCAPRLETPNDGSDAGPGQPTGPIWSEDKGDDLTLTHVNATDDQRWIYFAPGAPEAVEPELPEMSSSWTLGFRRFHIKMNGGVSGTGGVELVVITDVPFADITQAPADGYIADMPDIAEDEDDLPQYPLSTGDTKWFDYNPATHVLTPNQTVYIVRSVEGDYFKMRVTGYYDDAGSPAHIRFEWAPVAPPG